MNDRKMAYSAISITCVVFLIIGFFMYYPIYCYYQGDITLLNFIFNKLSSLTLLKIPYYNKLILFILITASVLIYRPKKDQKITFKKTLGFLILGVFSILLSEFILSTYSYLYGISVFLYVIGFSFSVDSITKLFKILHFKDVTKEDPFNYENETFLQTEEKIENAYSVNIAYEYYYKKKIRKGWINFVNLFRALIVIGTPGSGKSFAFIEEILEQFINKFFTLVIYDFKFDTLTKIAYNYWCRFKAKHKGNVEQLKKVPQFFFICFDNVNKSHRCNPIDPYLMTNQTDAADAATSIMKNLNREWIRKNDFFSRSAISFVSGLMWFLKKKAEAYGKNICTLPHVIILSTVNIEYLLKIMLNDLEVRNLMIPFKDALEREAGQQLSGQTASAQISLSMLANKELFFVMSGNDFRLDINNPLKPKIVSIQNNPDRSEVYAAPIGLYINKILQVVNKPNKRPMGLIVDELPTIFIMNLRKIIDTGRSNLIATVLGIQSLAQMITDYGKELADVIFENCANIACGSAKGETAKRISAIFGKTHQSKNSLTISREDTTTNIAPQKDDLLPTSKIASMSTGHFAGIVADEFKTPIKQKLFFGKILPNLESKKLQNAIELPEVRSFKTANHKETLNKKLELFEQLDMYNTLKHIDTSYEDYIQFYNSYLIDFSNTHYSNPLFKSQFIETIKELELFNHLSELKTIFEDTNTSKKENTTRLKNYFSKVLDKTLEHTEKSRVLNENFMAIIKDIDHLVQNEYYSITGDMPEFTIFDKDKLDTEITGSIEDNESAAINFMNDFNKMDTKEILNLFDDTLEQKQTDIGTEDDEGFSSHDVEIE